MSFFVVSEMSHAEAGISGSPYACVRGILQILSPQFKEHHAQAWCFFRFGTATDGFPGLWVWPLPVADEGSSQRRRNRECADWPKGRRADDHVRKEISFPLEKTEKSVCTIPLVAQSARSEDGKHRRLFLMRWVFAGSNSCPPKRNGDAGGGFAEQSAWPSPQFKEHHAKQVPLKKTLFFHFLRGTATAGFRRKQSVVF